MRRGSAWLMTAGLLVLAEGAHSKDKVPGLAEAVRLVEEKTQSVAIFAEVLSVPEWNGFRVRAAGQGEQPMDYYVTRESGEASAEKPIPLLSAASENEPALLWESFETETGWTVQDWADPGAIALVQDQASEGRQSLRIQIQQGKAGKTALAKEVKLDLARSRALVLDALNQGKGVSLAVAFKTGEGQTYFETVSVPLAKGWTRDIAFKLGEPVLKSEASGWSFTTELLSRQDVRQVILLIYASRPEPGEVFLDHLRFVK